MIWNAGVFTHPMTVSMQGMHIVLIGPFMNEVYFNEVYFARFRYVPLRCVCSRCAAGIFNFSP
jgi:hypothetical protein